MLSTDHKGRHWNVVWDSSHPSTSVLKSGCEPIKKLATELDWYQLQQDCGCQSGGWAISAVVVAIA